MSYSIKFEDNSNKFKEDWKDKKQKILYALGLKWQSICTSLMTSKKIVDTGRLRASLTFITNEKIGAPTNKVAASEANDFLSGSSGNENDLIVGSNVIYAKKVEFTGRKGAFIKPSITEYREDYKNIIESVMKEG